MLWWPSGRPLCEVKLDYSRWALVINKKRVPLLEISSADWYYACKKVGDDSKAWSSISKRWDISTRQAKIAMVGIWKLRIAPKARTFLWIVMHQALPTSERKHN